MAFDNQGDNGAISQINVTPLVDVMLVLLVIFMVTAPILQQGVSVSLPQVEAAPLAADGEELVVTVAGDGKVFLNDDPLDSTQLAEKLATVAGETPARQVFLRADRDVPYGEVMRVIALVREVGIAKLGMVTEPPSEMER